MSRLVNRINLILTRYSQLRNILSRRLSATSIHCKFIAQEKNIFSTSSVFTTITAKPLTRHVSSDISDAEMDPMITEIDEICEQIDDFRQTLYGSDLADIEKLNKVENIKELMETIKLLNEEEMSKELVCQSIIILWDILRQDMLVLKQTEIEKISKEAEMQRLLERLNHFLEKGLLTFDEMSCVLMYLNKLGFKIKDPLLQQIIEAFNDKLQGIQSPTSITLSALSRFVVAIFDETGLYPCYSCINILTHIYQQLQFCKTSESMRLITICLIHLTKMVSDDILRLYKIKVEELLKLEVLNNTTIKTNLKVLLLLNHPDWAIHNTKLTREILLLAEPDIPTMQIKELFLVHKNIRKRLEPWNMVPSIVKRCDELMETTLCPELLQCSLLETLPEKRRKLAKIAELFITNLDPSCDSVLPSLFKSLRLLKTSNLNLCNMYWDKVVQDIESESNNIFKTIRHINRYMHFNNNLGGTYRHRELERTVIAFIFKEFQTGLYALMPSVFARSVSFVIAYSDNLSREESFPEFIIEKIESMSEQFNIYDCLRISKGIQIAHDLKYKFYIPAKEAPFLLKIEEVLNKCTERHIHQTELNINDLNLVLKAFNSRKCSRKSHLFQKIISKYNDIDDICLSSRTIRDLTQNLLTSSFRIPQLFEKFVYYIIQNQKWIGGETLEKTLTCFYATGYVPGNEEFYKIANEIIKRDFNFISGLAIIQSCLALVFFKRLNKDLISLVFNINFIKRLEDEIESCYSKETYPERVLNNVMQLNRAVCLDCPEANIPWFQQNYIEAQMSKAPNNETKFSIDVKKTLYDLVPDMSWIKTNLVTPYGYKIDFVLYLNENQKFIPPTPEDRSILGKITKIAIVPLRAEAFCENPPYSDLKGMEALKTCHLEILGYKVIHINYRDWNSMYLSLPGARLEYVKRLIGLS